jgi:hypothetical protein
MDKNFAVNLLTLYFFSRAGTFRAAFVNSHIAARVVVTVLSRFFCRSSYIKKVVALYSLQVVAARQVRRAGHAHRVCAAATQMWMLRRCLGQHYYRSNAAAVMLLKSIISRALAIKRYRSIIGARQVLAAGITFGDGDVVGDAVLGVDCSAIAGDAHAASVGCVVVAAHLRSLMIIVLFLFLPIVVTVMLIIIAIRLSFFNF